MIRSNNILLFIFSFFLLPLSGQKFDSTIISRSAYDVSDSLMFGWVPGGQHDSIPAYSGNSIFTTDYEPSGSYWDPGCDEEDVFLARLIHKEADSVHWNLGIGRAGIIYSFIGPYGEGVPPQVHSSSGLNLAPWIDEVWQIVSVNNVLNNADRIPAPPGSSLASTVRSMPYFIHGAGAYRNDTMYARLPAPFYSPLMSSWYNQQERALYTTNWGTQAHIPSLHKSQLLYTNKYKDLGNGIMENTMIIQNFGDVQVNYHNMPWGGVRASNLPQVWLSKPDHSLERSYKTFGGDDSGIVSSIDLTGGYMIWAAEGYNDDRPALAVVYGYEQHKAEFKDKYNMSGFRLRWGLTGNVERSYTVFELNPIIDINQGKSFFSRIYYINGTFKEVHEKAKKIANAPDYGFIQLDPENVARTVIKTSDHFNALKEDIQLFAEPVADNIPLFLMENTQTGIPYISPDLYHNVPTLPFVNPYAPSDPKYETYQNRIVYRQYNGTIKYLRLLGYGVKLRDKTPDIRYKLLDSLITDSTRIIIPNAYKKKIWIPFESCNGCSYGLDPQPLLPGYELYSDFGENRIYQVQNPVNLNYSHSELNPAQIWGNLSRLTGKVIRQTGTSAYFFLEVPGNIDLSGHGTFRLRVYYKSKESIIPPCNVGLILRHNGDENTQYEKWKEVTLANRWIEFTFNCHLDNPIEKYNQVFIYFSSPDNENQAAGQTFYIDELTGPPVIVPVEDYNVTFRVKNKITGSLLQDIDVTVGQEEIKTAENGEALFTLIKGNWTYRISHPDYVETESSIEVSSDTVVQIFLTPDSKQVIFSIYSERTGNPLPNISVIVGNDEFISGINGMAILDLYKGNYNYSLSHPDYFIVTSTLELRNDTTIHVVLLSNKASIKFRIYAEGNPLYNTIIQLNDSSLTTNQTGIALYANLARFEDYNWTASKEGYEDSQGAFNLLNDTTVNISMILLTNSEGHRLNGLTFYPNPAHSKLFIESDEIIQRIEICDLRGALLYFKEINGKNASIDIAALQNGIYITRVYRDEIRTVSMKLIKSE